MKLPQQSNILLLGNGGRECAFAAKIAESQMVGKLFIAPGNAGTSAYGTNVDIDPLDFSVVKHFASTNFVNLIVVGPEEPLVRGIRDYFLSDDEVCHIPVLGPSKAAAMLEGSKDFSKAFMARHNIPTARYFTVSSGNIPAGINFLRSLQPPYVLKADGLAAGKGVLIIDDLDVAIDSLTDMITAERFGKASSKVVIEEFLKGVECSIFVATDGKSYKLLPEAKDYKRIGDGDTGLNTGGMGAVSPVPFADEKFISLIRRRIIEPTIKGIKADGLDYCGFIFIGIMNCNGEPYVVEYNVRMGDPETEVVLPRIQSDIVDLFDGIVHHTLRSKEIIISPKTALTVVCTSGGYPGDYQKGFTITGLNDVQGSTVFHSGTKLKGKDVVTAGGRVLAVTSLSTSIKAAASKSYKAIGGIKFEGIYYRRDIGRDVL